MKKMFIVFVVFCLLSSTAFCKLRVLSGRNNLSMLKNAKPVYILLTFNDLKIYNEPIDEFIALINKKKVNVWRLTKQSMIEEYKERAHKFLKVRKSWNMKLVESASQAKGGYIIYLNYDFDNPTPPVGANGQATGTVFKTGSKNPIIQFRSNCFFMQYWEVKVNFPGQAENFLEDIYLEFLNHINKDRLGSIK